MFDIRVDTERGSGIEILDYNYLLKYISVIDGKWYFIEQIITSIIFTHESKYCLENEHAYLQFYRGKFSKKSISHYDKGYREELLELYKKLEYDIQFNKVLT